MIRCCPPVLPWIPMKKREEGTRATSSRPLSGASSGRRRHRRDALGPSAAAARGPLWTCLTPPPRPQTATEA